MIKNLALITTFFEGGAVAKKFKDAVGESGEVIVGVVENLEDIYLPEELEAMKADGKDPNDEEGKRDLRLKTFDGILPVYAADEVVKYLKNQEHPEEWFVFFDMNYAWKVGEELAEFMPHGNFPTQEQRSFEVDREKAKKFIEDNYPDIAKQKVWKFENVADGEKFVRETDEVLVLKGENADAPTVVPGTTDVETAREVILDALQKNAELYNAGGFIFEVLLDDGVELTAESQWYDGKLLFTTLDIETKRKYAGDVGSELVGCATDLVLVTNPQDKINLMSFPPIVERMAREAGGWFLWDLSVFISKRTKKAYPGEFCPNRCGWNSFMTELEGLNVQQFFNDIVEGKNPMAGKKVSSSVRIFNDDAKKDDHVKIIFPEEIKDHVWVMDAMMEDGALVTNGYDYNQAVVTGHGETFALAVEGLYSSADRYTLATKRWGYRSKGDYFDTFSEKSIVNRFNYAVEQGFITGYEKYNPFEEMKKSMQESIDASLQAVSMGIGMSSRAHALTIEKMKKEHEQKMEDLKQQHEIHLGNLKGRYEDDVESLTKKIDDILKE